MRKTTATWETLVQALLGAGLTVSAILAASHGNDGRNGQELAKPFSLLRSSSYAASGATIPATVFGMTFAKS